MNELKLLRDILTIKSESACARERSELQAITRKSTEKERTLSLQTALGGEMLKSSDLDSIVNLLKLGGRCNEHLHSIDAELAERKLSQTKLARESERLSAGKEFVSREIGKLLSKARRVVEQSEIEERRK
jgi:hypothetical protein